MDVQSIYRADEELTLLSVQRSRVQRGDWRHLERPRHAVPSPCGLSWDRSLHPSSGFCQSCCALWHIPGGGRSPEVSLFPFPPRFLRLCLCKGRRQTVLVPGLESRFLNICFCQAGVEFQTFVPWFPSCLQETCPGPGQAGSPTPRANRTVSRGLCQGDSD